MKTSRTTSIFTDFAGSLIVALTIGVATSVTLAGAVVLIANGAGHHETQDERGTS